MRIRKKSALSAFYSFLFKFEVVNLIMALHNLKTGVLYKNPEPHIRSIHAYFPSVAVLESGEMLATIVLGEAFEAMNLCAHVARSVDGGGTWTLEGPIDSGTPGRLTSNSARLSLLPDGRLVALVARFDRTEHPDEGLSNPDTIGFAPTDFLLYFSDDAGRSWDGPEKISTPFGDVPLEICAPVTPLKNGRCLIPTSTWNLWDDGSPYGFRMVVLVSDDGCRTWPDSVDVMVDPAGKTLFWESKVVELPDSRLLTVVWKHDIGSGIDLPNHYSLSGDGGRSWSEPRTTGLMGQTPAPFVLDDGRVLCVYRRMDVPGLWANVSRIEGDEWINEASEPLWGHTAGGLTGSSVNPVENFATLRFGAPCIAHLPNGTVFVAFWCYEDCISVIRWFKFTV